MNEPVVSQIRVGEHRIGIIGMESAMAEIAESRVHLSDEEIQAGLLSRLSKKNYIAPNMREAFGRAFLKVFKQFLGEDCQEKEKHAAGLDIKVLGPGCSQCSNMTAVIRQTLSEMKLTAALEHVTDIKEIGRYGAMGMPALVINEKVVWVGSVPPKEKLKSWLQSD
jgi:hypothetical protein